MTSDGNAYDTETSRRRFLHAGGVGILGAAALVGCDLLSTDPAGNGRAGASGDARNREAPALSDEVRMGTLPERAKRLPDDPLVVKPVDRIGSYGGRWRYLSPGPSTDYPQLTTMGYENLVRWRPDTRFYNLDEIIPNIASSVDYDPTGTEYTFTLRPGMLWSDGKPFGADDILFWYEYVLLDPDITPAKPDWLGVGDDPVRVEKVDDHTVRFVFAQPNGLFLHNLAAPQGGAVTGHPAHYVRQFHQAHNPNAEQMAKDAGLERWADLYLAKSSWFENPDRPVVFPWQLEQAPGEAVQRVDAVRNPYYWKVDPDGNQLPYLDRVSYSMVEEIDTMVLKATAGEVDMQNWLLARLQDKPIYHENQERGDYHLYETISAEMNVLMLGLNMTHQDPVQREIFGNKDFRIGLSHAINRQDIIDVVYQRQGRPWQGAPRPESPFHDERLATQYTEFDVDIANTHLDRAGYTERDAAGMRLGPDGKPIAFAVEVITDETAAIDTLELVSRYWEAVGVQMTVKSESRALWTARKDANEHDAAVWIGDGGLDLILLPRWYAPMDTWGSLFGLSWAQWYVSGGATGEEPPAGARRQMELYDQVRGTADQDQQAALLTELLAVAREEFWAIGISLTPAGYGVVKNDFHNVPDVVQAGYTYPNQAPTNPEQYFTEE